MVSDERIFIDYLKRNGYSVTATRLVVFHVLKNMEPQTMSAIIISARSVDRASVYRTINLFEKLGIVHRLQRGWKHTFELSDHFHPHHHHIVCTKCKKTVKLDNIDRIEGIINALAMRHGFRPSSHQIEIAGLCKDCQKMTPS